MTGFRTSFTWCACFVVLGLFHPAHATLMQTFQASGQLGLEVTAMSNITGQLPALTGTLSLTQIPVGAVVQKAFVYSHDWTSNASLDLVFGAAPRLTTPPFQSDNSTVSNHLFGYRWDVTPFVAPMPASYNFTIGIDATNSPQGNQIAAASLVVIWQDPLAPRSTVTIIDGAQQVGENTPLVTDTESVTFTGLPAGPTVLYTFTVSDDKAGSGEVVRYNGSAVGGPIDENLGLGASLLQMSTTSLVGSNTASITSSADHFGWVFAATKVTPSASSRAIPEPLSAALFVVGLTALVATNRRRR